uniref:Uncharacterized protein n=1 Tax=Meloidogyne enterolobii TaxID=390850 RepID=A0A6V7XHZ9_MELEN|nr:unnamed protein product [Meloidogyne enterolobii]
MLVSILKLDLSIIRTLVQNIVFYLAVLLSPFCIIILCAVFIISAIIGFCFCIGLFLLAIPLCPLALTLYGLKRVYGGIFKLLSTTNRYFVTETTTITETIDKQ